MGEQTQMVKCCRHDLAECPRDCPHAKPHEPGKRSDGLAACTQPDACDIIGRIVKCVAVVEA